MSIFNLWKQLPDLQIDDSRDNTNHNRDEYEYVDGRFRAMMEEKYGVEFEPWDKDKWIDCPACKRWFKTEERLRMHAPICPEPIV
jgi:hypothetical protein